MAEYVPPEDVTAPRRQWSLIKVLVDTKLGGFALALGKWGDVPVFAMRWNGSKKRSDGRPDIGNPQSRGLATWFIVPEDYNDAVFRTLPSEKQALVQNFIKPKH